MAVRPEKPLVTVVCPVYNEAETVPLFYARFKKAIALIEEKVRFELLFVNNRSTDGTLEVIRGLRANDPRVLYLTMSRNFGYQASITAGMRHARGDAIMNIDVDCEDPPEMLPKFIDRWLGGADVAYGIRRQREEFFLMHWARKLFYRVTRVLSDHEIVLDMAEFFLVDKRVRDVVLSTRSTFPFVRGQVGFAGFKREGIAYKRERRIHGETHYSLLSAVRFGVAGILSSSTFALRMLAYIGIIGSFANILCAAALLARGDAWLELALKDRVLWAVLALQVGFLMFAAGIMSLYLARVYKDSMGLPLYIVDEHLSEAAP